MLANTMTKLSANWTSAILIISTTILQLLDRMSDNISMNMLESESAFTCPTPFRILMTSVDCLLMEVNPSSRVLLCSRSNVTLTVPHTARNARLYRKLFQET